MARLETQILTDGATRVFDGRGSARLLQLAPGIVPFTCKGTLTYPFYMPMVTLAQRELDASGRLVMFVEGFALHAVDTAFREAWTVWFRANEQRFHMQLLVRSRLMLMAANLANLFAGTAVIQTFKDQWERACRRDYAPFRHLEHGG